MLRLVGPSRSPPRAVDVAADLLLSRLALQLPPGLQGDLREALDEWRRNLDTGARDLRAVAAPFLLRAAREAGQPEPEASGELARSVRLLAGAAHGAALGLQATEWAVAPFLRAEVLERETALGLVAEGCALGGAPLETVVAAGHSWILAGGAPGTLGIHVVRAALSAWEQQGVRGRGLEQMREAHAWLSREVLREETSVSASRSGAEAALWELTTLLSTIDGIAPSLPDLRRLRVGALQEISQAGAVALADAVATAWSAAVPGLTPGAAAAHFDLWWRGIENDRSVVQLAVRDAVDDLRFKTQLRMQATWAGGVPAGGQAPAWRVEGRRKVPWFLPDAVVSEAASNGLPVPVVRPAYLEAAGTIERAKTAGGGRCIYCGSDHELRAVFVWPRELGGQPLESNLATACGLCQDFLELLGPRRWGQVLATPPQETAVAWWEAQKKANMKTINFAR